jgi:prepilin-type N-terminal cleavage/methylation domain-containing protein
MRKQDKGFTLIELMIVVTIIGILAVVAGPELMKYQTRAKTSEAIQNVAKVAEGARAYYLEELSTRDGSLIQKQFPVSIGPTPQQKACVNNAPQKLNPVDFSNPENFGHQSWQSLQFGVSKPFMFRYTFASQGTGNQALFSARAQGDLDCDNIESLFEQSARVDDNNQVVINPLYRERELE